MCVQCAVPRRETVRNFVLKLGLRALQKSKNALSCCAKHAEPGTGTRRASARGNGCGRAGFDGERLRAHLGRCGADRTSRDRHPHLDLLRLSRPDRAGRRGSQDVRRDRQRKQRQEPVRARVLLLRTAQRWEMDTASVTSRLSRCGQHRTGRARARLHPPRANRRADVEPSWFIANTSGAPDATSRGVANADSSSCANAVVHTSARCSRYEFLRSTERTTRGQRDAVGRSVSEHSRNAALTNRPHRPNVAILRTANRCEVACGKRAEFNTQCVTSSSMPPGNAPGMSVERSLPHCTSCGRGDVRRSHSRKLFDGVARTLGFKAYRCRGCRARFFAR